MSARESSLPSREGLSHTFLFHGTGTSSGLPLVPCLTSSPTVEGIKCRSCRETIETGKDGIGGVGTCAIPGASAGDKNVRGNTGGILRKRIPSSSPSFTSSSDDSDQWLTIIIDVGKTFTNSALRYFRANRITRIDAIVLTHFHSDAIAGLDDLRAFTAGPPTLHTDSIDPTRAPERGSAAALGYKRTERIPIYLSKETLEGVTKTTPYLVLDGMASGGGDLPSLEWIVFDDHPNSEGGEVVDSGTSMQGVLDGTGPEGDVGGDTVFIALSNTEEGEEENLSSVTQGASKATFIASKHTPNDSFSSRPIVETPPAHNQSGQPSPSNLARVREERQLKVDGPDGFWIRARGCGVWVVPVAVDHGKYFSPPTHLSHLSSEEWIRTGPHAFPCNGFVFDGKIVYLGDLNRVPEKAWRRIVRAVEDGVEGDVMNSGSGVEVAGRTDLSIHADVVDLPADNPPILPASALPILILDCLKLTPHPSHISFLQSLNLASLVRAQRTYLLGFTHPVAHDEWVAGCKVVDGTRVEGEEDEFVGAVERSLPAHQKGKEVWDEVKRWGGHVRPAFDGLLLGLTKDGRAIEVLGTDLC